jgi:predicted RNA-binding protein with PUA-like domain
MPRLPDNGRYWLFKSEPDAFSIDDLMRAKGRRAPWDGIRNYQARNLLRDEVKCGDGVLFYHSNTRPLAVVGVAEVVKEAYPDPTAFDPDEKYFDPKSDPAAPTWLMVDIKGLVKFDTPVTRDRLMEIDAAADMMLLRRGARLSIQPVAPAEWNVVLEEAGLR